MKQVNNSQNFVYRPLKGLPLDGEDYSFSVNRKGTDNDYTITKKGNEIFIDHADETKDIKITVEPDKIFIDKFGSAEDLTIYKSDNKIFIDRPGFKEDVTIIKSSEKIAVHRNDPTQNVAFSRQPGEKKVKIDRYGYLNDLEISWDDHSVFINKFGDDKDVIITRSGPMKELDSNIWHQDFTVPPEGWSLINKWFKEGFKAEWLVTVAEDGNVYLLDEYLK